MNQRYVLIFDLCEDFCSQYSDLIWIYLFRLPLPWLLYFIIFTLMGDPPEYISVTSKGMACSIGILFLMIILLIISIAVFRWQMNKLFGAVMLITYVIFCIISVLLETDLIDCPLKIVSKICVWLVFDQTWSNIDCPLKIVSKICVWLVFDQIW